MSFGLEMWDENGNEVFAVGRKYFVYLGVMSFPAASSSNQNSIREASFSLPASVPANEDPFVSVSAMYPNGFVSMEGRQVKVDFMLRQRGSTWERGRVDVIYGYYA